MTFFCSHYTYMKSWYIIWLICKPLCDVFKLTTVFILVDEHVPLFLLSCCYASGYEWHLGLAWHQCYILGGHSTQTDFLIYISYIWIMDIPLVMIMLSLTLLIVFVFLLLHIVHNRVLRNFCYQSRNKVFIYCAQSIILKNAQNKK